MSLALASRRAAISPAWVKNSLWRTARAVPSLDLQFADTKSLADAVTGQSLVTFTRASSGTYVGSDGLIKTATTNLLLRSEEFDNASWAKTLSTVTANAAAAPNGSIAADKLIGNSTVDQHYAQQNISGAISGISYTSSVYAKASEISRIEILHAVGSTLYVQGYDLSNGTLLTRVTPGTTAATGGFIQSVGDGWYRCGIMQTSDGTSGAMRITLRSVNAVSFDATSLGVLLFGAQLEQSSTVGEYIPTTSTINSAPRFDHNPTTGESLGLLVEEQRTNLFPSSIYTANANGWTNGIIGGTGTIASASVTNKAGNTNGVFNVSGLDGNSYVGCFVSTASSTNTYTASVFVKNNGGTFFQLRLVNQTGGTFKSSGTQYTFATGAWQDGVAGTAAPISRSVQDMGDGWFRFSITAADNGTGNTQTSLLLFGGSTTTNYNFYLWGAQLEAGAFPTSYIPTTTATATRSADVASSTGTAFSSWYRQDEGTFYADVFRQFAVPANEFPVVADCRTGTNINQFSYLTEAVAGTYVAVSGVIQSELYPGSLTGARNRRLAHGYAANNFAATANGSIPLTDTSGSVPAVNAMSIGSVSGNTQFLNGTIRRLTYFPARLANSTLQAITQ